MPDMMPKPPMPPQGMPPKAGGDPIKDNMSLMNPTDMAAMSQGGEISPDAPLEQTLTSPPFNFDLKGPTSQLFEFGKKQVQNATAMGKMRNMSKAPGNTPPPPAQPAPGGQGPEPGMESLLKNLQ